MITKPKAARFFLGRVARPAPPPQPAADDLPFASNDDGFGNQDFRQAEAAAPAGPPQNPADDQALAAIAAEGLTGRQLRRARLLAQSQQIPVQSDLDAVLQLRRAGIDPFAQGDPTDPSAPDGEPLRPAPVPSSGDAAPPGGGRALARLPGDKVQLPKTTKPISPPAPDKRAEQSQASEIQRMQRDIATRRRRRLALLFGRLLVFVLLPTILAGWYFYRVATPLYATKSEFQIQTAGATAGGGGGLGGLLSGTALATSTDSITVQGYLQSREAMLRLEEDLGFRAHFQNPLIDPLQRLDPDATMEAAYRAYNSHVKISYDPTEGLIRMEVMAVDPDTASAWAGQLISYAEEQVDQLTQRVREAQMVDAQTGYEDAQTKLTEAQRQLITLQEDFNVLSSDTELGLVTNQIAMLEGQLTQDRLSLAQMESNATPNLARMEPLKLRIKTLEDEIASLRSRMTEGSAGGASLAEVQGELLMAQADVQTRQMILAQAVQSVELARVEAARQVRYLSVSVSPTPPDEAAYPKAFENTMVTLLILLGIYLMVSMTAAILREQVSS
jgi:capsular polysaccharide transport system permease protein